MSADDTHRLSKQESPFLLGYLASFGNLGHTLRVRSGFAFAQFQLRPSSAEKAKAPVSGRFCHYSLCLMRVEAVRLLHRAVADSAAGAIADQSATLVLQIDQIRRVAS